MRNLRFVAVDSAQKYLSGIARGKLVVRPCTAYLLILACPRTWGKIIGGANSRLIVFLHCLSDGGRWAPVSVGTLSLDALFLEETVHLSHTTPAPASVDSGVVSAQ